MCETTEMKKKGCRVPRDVMASIAVDALKRIAPYTADVTIVRKLVELSCAGVQIDKVYNDARVSGCRIKLMTGWSWKPTDSELQRLSDFVSQIYPDISAKVSFKLDSIRVHLTWN